MEQRFNMLITYIENRKPRLSPKYKLAYKKFRIWQSYYRNIILNAKGNPNIISMAFTQKLLAFMGIAESIFASNIHSSDKIIKFFKSLDINTKFLLMMAVRYGCNRTLRKKRELIIVRAFLLKRYLTFNKYFQQIVYIKRNKNDSNKGRALYNLRSRLVHRGEYIMSWIQGSTNEILVLNSPDLQLEINEKIISLDEVFLRGLCIKARITPPSLASDVRQFLINNSYSIKFYTLFRAMFSNKMNR